MFNVLLILTGTGPVKMKISKYSGLWMIFLFKTDYRIINGAAVLWLRFSYNLSLRIDDVSSAHSFDSISIGMNYQIRIEPST